MMIHEIKVPTVGVNDPVAKVVEWCVQDKDKVKEGDLLCCLETSKVAFDLEAEYCGYVRITVEAGTTVSIQSGIGFITDRASAEVPETIGETRPKNDVRPTRKAVALAKELAVDIADIGKSGVIREKDVRSFYELSVSTDTTAESVENPRRADIGSYNVDPQRYEKLVNKMYEEFPEIVLPSEYSYFVQKDLLRLLIRLARYKFVARLVRAKDEVLEIGCGSGLGTVFLGQHCARILGIEVKSTEIEEARSINHRENVEFVCGDVFELPAEKKYDVVVALDVIEHMPMEQGDELLNTISNRLKPCGMAVIGTPSIYSYEYQSPLSKASHVKCYDLQELLGLVDKYFQRVTPFSMNDEIVHTGHPKMAWYYFVLAFCPNS